MYSFNRRFHVMHAALSLGFGGLERVILGIVRGINPERFQSSVCCLEQAGELAEEARSTGARVFVMHKRAGFDYGLPVRLASLLRRERVDILHTHDWCANLYGVIAGKLAGIEAIVKTEHGAIRMVRKRQRALDRWASLFTDRIVGVSKNLKDYLAGEGIWEEKLMVIYNGINLELFRNPGDGAATRRSFGLGPDSIVIIHVGVLRPEKMFPLLSLIGPEKMSKRVILPARMSASFGLKRTRHLSYEQQNGFLSMNLR